MSLEEGLQLAGIAQTGDNSPLRPVWCLKPCPLPPIHTCTHAHAHAHMRAHEDARMIGHHLTMPIMALRNSPCQHQLAKFVVLLGAHFAGLCSWSKRP
eukprot:5327491-Amphidinium_carterae.3